MARFVTGRLVAQTLGLAALIELLTCFTRFGLGLRAVDHAHWVIPYTLGVRVHHGYYGLLLALVGGVAMLVASRPPRSRGRLLLIAGLALALSDLVHHFIVLWAVTGSPEFP